MKAKTPKKTKPKLTNMAFAQKLGITRQALACHLKKPGAPKVGDVPGWIEFLAAHGRSGSAPDDLRRKIAQKRLEILAETKAKLARENQVATGELMSRAEAMRENAAAWSFVFEKINRRLCDEYPPLLAGQSAVEIHEKLCAFREELRRDAKQKFERAA